MEDQDSPLSWPYYFQEEGIEELKHSLFYTTLELETTILSAQEELARKDDELQHFKGLLTKTIGERDEFQAKCQRLMLERLLLQQQLQQQFQHPPEIARLTGTTSSEDEPRGGESNTGFSSSDCDENITESSSKYPIPPPTLPLPPPEVTNKLDLKKPLPEQGKFLQAVMEAGPLLQTLLLAGPLPQWQHPPPQLNTIEIPPVTISSPTPRLLHQDSCASTGGCFSKKRGVVNSAEVSDLSPNTKYQKVVHQSSLTNI
ncbi:unnamed protein product [Ilex paraguariensis]